MEEAVAAVDAGAAVAGSYNDPFTFSYFRWPNTPRLFCTKHSSRISIFFLHSPMISGHFDVEPE